MTLRHSSGLRSVFFLSDERVLTATARKLHVWNIAVRYAQNEDPKLLASWDLRANGDRFAFDAESGRAAVYFGAESCIDVFSPAGEVVASVPASGVRDMALAAGGNALVIAEGSNKFARLQRLL